MLLLQVICSLFVFSNIIIAYQKNNSMPVISTGVSNTHHEVTKNINNELFIYTRLSMLVALLLVPKKHHDAI